MSSVSVGSLHAEPSSARPEMTIGRRKAMRKAKRRIFVVVWRVHQTVRQNSAVSIQKARSIVSSESILILLILFCIAVC